MKASFGTFLVYLGVAIVLLAIGCCFRIVDGKPFVIVEHRTAP
jgi:hypothetical protein